MKAVYFVLIILAAIMNGASFVNMFAVIPIGFIVFMNLGNHKLNRYFRVMPIRPRTLLLWDYLYNLAALAFGVVVTIIIVAIFHENAVVGISFTLLVVGTFLLALGLGNIIFNLIAQKYWYLGLLADFVAIIPLYLLFGASTIHGIVRGRVAGVYITSSPIFTDIRRWLAFVAIGMGFYAVSYFVALALYKKKDYQPPIWWH